MTELKFSKGQWKFTALSNQQVFSQFSGLKDGEVQIPVDKYLKLIERFKKLQKTRPQNQFLINSISLDGTAEDECAMFKIVFEVMVLNEKDWTLVRLLPTSVAVHEGNVEIIDTTNDENDTKKKKAEGYLGVINGEHQLMASKKGVYKVTLQISVNYEKTQGKELRIRLPNAVQNYLKLKIPDENVQVKISPSLNIIQNSSKDQTIVECSFQSTQVLVIHWTPTVAQDIEEESEESQEELVDSDEEEEDENVQLSVSVDQNTLHQIGEGLVKSRCSLNYSIVHGSITSTTIAIETYGKEIRIISVDGRGVHKWDTIQDEVPSLDDKSTKKLLKVYFRYGVENSCNLVIRTDLEMGGTSAKLFVPSFTCCDKFVTREKGTLGIVARTNVEIKEEQKKYLGRIDPLELPQESQRFAEAPILHAYKFLDVGHELFLSVTRHDDVGVLCTCIDEGYYQITQTDSNLFHRIQMLVKNTAKQYLRVTLPHKKCEVYSTTVDGSPVKPSSETKGEKTQILIPLTSKDFDNNTEFAVCLTFTAPSLKMVGSGEVEIEFAEFDAPCNIMFVSVFLPDTFHYGEFEGNLEEVQYYSMNSEVRNENFGIQTRKPRGGTYNINKPTLSNELYYNDAVMENFNNILDSNIADVSDIQLADDISDRGFYAGVKPVNIKGLGIGKHFKFEKFLLMENKPLKVKVPFKEKTKSIFERRSTSSYANPILLFFVLCAILLMGAVFAKFKSPWTWTNPTKA